ncbi:polyadenylation and cleavage factor homolog 4 isoform X2 [Arachis hypogaea]|uniref:CID domain-containing protein n=2 Tax=Arachis hypogaea TaxID=3818 RepID=A0A445CQB0_ARAHY|nr:polyadenylation and cleavage factor homolog 4 isoform X2 [Arachis hypogaea]QHO46500.1 uncharacterized protein DS421_6g187980 [Arachis hypogaea]RYR53094.1 hypothetical protein Ahy_A06g027995 [Arachis hypogaea]
MNMESTRRSFDRSREPGAKKPRLIDELDSSSNPISRPFSQPRQPPSSAVTPLTSATARFRTNSDRDSESSDRYHPQPPPHQELVSQYKAALAELTFNSKPIITNLTIIAGENLSAAKAIAGTVCTNILEVPNEQKLPSLYLLDSIVKNIGRDYIKYFAARLPEVFIKAYKQVDPPVHSSMRHLFGTWKGYFPPQTLQMIEKELGFTPAVNGSASSSATLRSESQSQRPAHSIHVNPKYLERQRLQQSSRIKGVANDTTRAILNSNEDSERSSRVLGASRPWLDPRINMHRIQRDAYNNSVPEKSLAESYGAIKNSSGISSIGTTGSRVTELGHDKTWYKAGISVAENTSNQSNGFSLKLGFSNREAPKSMNLGAHHQPTQNLTSIQSSVVPGSWKNSEEEEFMWDEMNSGMIGDGAASIANNMNTEPWMGGDDENLDGDQSQILHHDREISTARKQSFASGGHSSLPWQLQEQRSNEKLNLRPGHSEKLLSALGCLPANTSSLVVRMPNQSSMPNATKDMSETMGQKQFDSMGTKPTSVQSPLQQQSASLPVTKLHPHPTQNLLEQDNGKASKTSQFLGDLQRQYIRDQPAALPPNAQVGRLHRSREKDLHGPLSSETSFLPRHQQQPLVSSQTEVIAKTKPLHSKVSLASESSEQSKSSLSAATVQTRFLNKSITNSFPGTSSSLVTKNLPSDLGVCPALSGRPSSATLISSVSAVASPSTLVPPDDDSSILDNISQANTGQKPKVSTKLPTSSNMSTVSAPTSTARKNNSLNPIANLLSSLVAKGLISTDSESSTKVPTEALVQLEARTESITASSSLPVPSVTGSTVLPVTSSKVVEDDAKASLIVSQSTNTKIRNIIGFDFKPDIVREMHPTVIKGLLDDSQHHCRFCGIKLKQEEQFNKHLEWHFAREREQHGLIRASRKWYENWFLSEPSDSVDDYCEETDRSPFDAMVPADESQCLCVLCGDLFEDVYCQERDEWMFKGAVYINNLDRNGEMESRNVGPIVHAKCLSENSVAGGIKMEQD